MSWSPVRFLHISDTHWSKEQLAEGIDSAKRMTCLRDWIRSIRDPIDFIIHTGDWVHRGQVPGDDGESTRAAWGILQELEIPVLTTIGNHDNRRILVDCLFASVSRQLAYGNIKLQAFDKIDERLAYHFQVRDESFLVLDARDVLAIDPKGRLCERQLELVHKLMSETDRRWTLFLHYPPLPLDCDWIDRTMLIENGQALHECLLPYAHRIRGVFFGHVHRPTCTWRDGILYASAGAVGMHFPNMPSDEKAIMQSDPIAFANYVTLFENTVNLKQEWFLIPSPSR